MMNSCRLSSIHSTMSTDRKIGWIGLGNMGLAMATHIQRHLRVQQAPGLSFTNRILSRGDELVALGSVGYATVQEVVQNSDIVFTSVSVK
jgi:3-hydroxyisobutyrate dehydrogenase-like beta-hydroxyacid dehydrogenase